MSRALAVLVSLVLALLGCSGTGDDAAPTEAALGTSSQALQSTTHEITYNTSATLSLAAGDVLRLKGFPSGWAYSSVEVNFDGTNAPLALVVSENTSQYTLSGWNKKIVVPYRRTATQDLVVKSGGGNARIVWWVSSSATSPADAPQDPEQPREGPVLRDLGGMNTATVVDGAGGLFTIKSLPSWSYNVVSLLVEPRDGKQLTGELAAGGAKTPLSGWSQKIRFAEHGSAQLAFELLLDSPRKLALSWFVEDRVPASKAIGRTLSGTGASVTAKYGFAAEHAVENDLSLAFNPADFSDGQLPAMKRLEHNPQGVRAPDLPEDLFGPTYDIHAKLKPGKKVQVALPIPEIALIRGIDEQAITILHYNEASKSWSEIVPDRISDGYVYFTTDSFSSFLSRMKRRAQKAANVVAAVVVAVVVVPAVVVTLVADKLVDVTKLAYKALVDGACGFLDWTDYVAMQFDKPSTSAARPDLTGLRQLPDFSDGALAAVAMEPLQPLATAPASPLPQVGQVSTPGELEAGRWQAAAQNARRLLADVLRSDGGARRFELKGTNGAATLVDRDPQPRDPVHPEQRLPALTYKVTDLFKLSSALFAAAPRALTLIHACDNAFGLNDEFKRTIDHAKSFVRAATHFQLGSACREALMLPADIVGWGGANCVEEAIGFRSFWDDKHVADHIDSRDAQILFAGEFFNALALAAWIDPPLRSVLGSGADQLRDQLHSYVGLTHGVYKDNNIVIKAMTGVATWDLVTRGDKSSYNTLKGWVEAKMGDAGGYAEGTGYLQYVNDDVPYVLASAVRGGFITRAELPQKYLKSGAWLLNQSRYLGGGGNSWQFLPVAVDDGNPKAIDFFVYGYLTGDGGFRRFATSQRDFRNIPAPLGYLGLPNADLPSSALPSSRQTLPDVYFADGVGVVRSRANSSSLMSTLTVVAEKGLMREGGAAHDQQDNGSVTLTHSHYWNQIEDLGYQGFKQRGATAYFDAHNVVMTPEALNHHGESSNGLATYRTAAHIISHLPGVDNLDPLSWLPAIPAVEGIGVDLFSFSLGASLSGGMAIPTLRVKLRTHDWDEVLPGNIEATAGGNDADLVGPLLVDSPLHASHGLEIKHTSSPGLTTTRRMLLSYGDNVWVIDRPTNKRALWSQMNFNAGAESSAFQYPLPTALPLSEERCPIPRESWGEGATQCPTVATVPQHGAPTLQITRLLRENGSAYQAPVFVTSLRNNSSSKPNISEQPCIGAVCLSNIGLAGQVDLVIVPRWGEQYLDDGQFQHRVRTGQIVLARRDASAWTFRLVGDQSPELLATSLSARTNHVPGVVYRLEDNGAFTAYYPNGTVQSLP